MMVFDKMMDLPRKSSKIHGAIYGVAHNIHMLDLLERIRQEYNGNLHEDDDRRKQNNYYIMILSLKFSIYFSMYIQL